MKKQEMIEVIKSEEKRLHKDMESMAKVFGDEHYNTELARARWATVRRLMNTMGIEKEY